MKIVILRMIPQKEKGEAMRMDESVNQVAFTQVEEGETAVAVDRKQQIERIANDILVQNDLINVGDAGFDLAKFLSQKEGFLVGEQNMEDGTTGAIYVDEQEFLPGLQTGKLIATSSDLQNSPDYVQRRRFIVAHEYGHYVLHMKEGAKKLYEHRDYQHQYSEQEREADFFARCLLMPKDLVQKVLSTLPLEASDWDKIETVSKWFNVTTKKAASRLSEDLRLI